MTMQNYITPVSRVDGENGLKFVIFDAPNDSNVHLYVKVSCSSTQAGMLQFFPINLRPSAFPPAYAYALTRNPFEGWMVTRSC